jgi:glycerol kinase
MNDIPAFPLPNHTRKWDMDKQEYVQEKGLTMRDYFAAKSITWFLTALENEGMVDEPALLRQFAAESAYRMADAMMKARDSK